MHRAVNCVRRLTKGVFLWQRLCRPQDQLRLLLGREYSVTYYTHNFIHRVVQMDSNAARRTVMRVWGGEIVCARLFVSEREDGRG